MDAYPKTTPIFPASSDDNKESVPFDPVVGWLVCIEGATKGTDYRIHSQNNYIGRSAKMDISIPEDSHISAENSAIIAYDNRIASSTLAPVPATISCGSTGSPLSAWARSKPTTF